MTCSACNTNLTSDAHFCPRCGCRLAFAAQPAAPTQPFWMPYTRVGRNLQTLGILWLVYAALRFVTGVFGMVFLHTLLGRHFSIDSMNFGWTPFQHNLFAHIWPFAFAQLLVSVACTALTAYALLTRQPWGRIFAIIFGILALIHLPFGTALGIYTLWVLAPTLSGNEYASIASTAHKA